MTALYARAVPEHELIDRREAARVLGVSVESVGRYARNGLLDRHRNRITGAVRYERAQVEKLRADREADK